MSFEEWLVLGPLGVAIAVYGGWRLYLALKYRNVP